MKHDIYTRNNISRYNKRLQKLVVEKGLILCRECGGVGGGLTTDCPGARVSLLRQYRVYKGEIDFVDGEWVEKEEEAE